MRLFLRAAAFIAALAAAGCAPRAIDMMQPPPAALRGAVAVESVELTLRPDLQRELAAADARLAERSAGRDPPEGRAALPFARMFKETVEGVVRARGLTAGRAVRLVVEMDELHVPGIALSALGRTDRLAGQVIVHDRSSDETLAIFYVTVDNAHPGLLGQLTRGTGIRERLAEAFARHIADQLGAPRRRR
jgi:hypothetical protein